MKPALCPSGHRLIWLTENVATCDGHPLNVWWAKRRGKRIVVQGVWNEAAVELAAGVMAIAKAAGRDG